MIGHPVKTFLLDETTLGTLDMTLGKKTSSVPITRILNINAEKVPQKEPIEEIMAVLPF